MKRIAKMIASVLLAALVGVCFAACTDDPPKPDAETYTLTLECDSSRGTLSATPPASGDRYVKGETVTVTVDIAPGSNYLVDTFTVNGESKTLTARQYTFQIEQDTVVRVTFKESAPPAAYLLSLDFNPEEGKVTATPPASGEKYALHEQVTVTVTPNEGYLVDAVTLNGAGQSLSEGAFTFAIIADTTVKVTFKEAPKPVRTFSVTLEFDDTKGSVTASAPASGNQYVENEVVTVTVAAADGFRVENFTVNGEGKSLTSGVYTFAILEDTVVRVTFEEIPAPPVDPDPDLPTEKYTVTLEYDSAAGTVQLSAPADGESYAAGEIVTVTVTAAEGFLVDALTVNGAVRSLDDGSYSFAISQDTQIKVTFKEAPKPVETYTLDLVYNETFGTVSASAPAAGGEKYVSGESVTITVAPKQGYLVESFTVGGESKSLSDGKYIFPITEDTVVNVVFKEEPKPAEFSLTLDYDAGRGTVTATPPASGSKYAENERVTITVLAVEGYEFASLTVNGKEEVLTSGSYVLYIVQDTTVTVTFKEKAPVRPSVSFPESFRGTWKNLASGASLLIDASSLKLQRGNGDELLSASSITGTGTYSVELDAKTYTLKFSASSAVLILEGETVSFWLNESKVPNIQIFGGIYGSYFAEGQPDLTIGADGIYLDEEKGVLVGDDSTDEYDDLYLLFEGILYRLHDETGDLVLTPYAGEDVTYRRAGSDLPDLGVSFGLDWVGTWVSVGGDSTIIITGNSMSMDGEVPGLAEVSEFINGGYHFTYEEEFDYAAVNYYTMSWSGEIVGVLFTLTDGHSTEFYMKEGTVFNGKIQEQFIREESKLWYVGTQMTMLVEESAITVNGVKADWFIDLGYIENLPDGMGSTFRVESECYYFLLDGGICFLYWEPDSKLPVARIGGNTYFFDTVSVRLPAGSNGTWKTLDGEHTMVVDSESGTITMDGEPLTISSTTTGINVRWQDADGNDATYSLNMDVSSDYFLFLMREMGTDYIAAETIYFFSTAAPEAPAVFPEGEYGLYGTWKSRDWDEEFVVSDDGTVKFAGQTAKLLVIAHDDGSAMYSYIFSVGADRLDVSYSGSPIVQITYKMFVYTYAKQLSIDLTTPGEISSELRGLYTDGMSTMLVKANSIVIWDSYDNGKEYSLNGNTLTKLSEGMFSFTREEKSEGGDIAPSAGGVSPAAATADSVTYRVTITDFGITLERYTDVTDNEDYEGNFAWIWVTEFYKIL